jgi:hypothetical protein
MLSQPLVQILIALIGVVGALGIIARYAVERLAQSNEKLTQSMQETLKASLEDDREFRKQIVESQKGITLSLENHLTTLYRGQNVILERMAVLMDREQRQTTVIVKQGDDSK